MRALPARSFAVFCILFCANCSRKSAISGAAAIVVDAGSIDSNAELDSGSPSSVSAWTDPPMIAALREDCAFDPLRLSKDRQTEIFGNGWSANALMCRGATDDQSCVYDPCFEGAESTCKSDCSKECDSCDDACVSSCFACKANCTDDVCRNACAPTCAQCKQSCLTKEDRCRTGKCGQAYADCRKKLDRDWVSQGCAQKCIRYEPCRDACFEKLEHGASPDFDAKGCIESCKSSLNTSCNLGLCGGKFGMGIQMGAP